MWVHNDEYRKPKMKTKWIHVLSWVWGNKNSEFETRVRWRNNLARWHHPTDIMNLNFWKRSHWVSCQLEVFVQRIRSGWWGACLFVPVHRPLHILSTYPSISIPLLLLYAVWISNKKWLLIVDREFLLFLCCQHPGNFVPTDHPERQKRFQMNCVISYLWIFQTQSGHRRDW